MGFIAAGYSPVFSNDISKDALGTYASAVRMIKTSHPLAIPDDHRIVCGDISLIDCLPPINSVDIVIGGPPCQGFSVAGKMNPEDPRSLHVFHFLDIVKSLNPVAFVMENVKALACNKRWESTIKQILRRAEELGYTTTLNVLNAADFGVPQTRERMVLVGVRQKTQCPVIAPPIDGHRVTVREALRSLPPYGSKGNDQFCSVKVRAAKKPVLRKSPWAGMMFNGQGRPINLEAPAPTLPASMGGNRTPIIDQGSLDDEALTPWSVTYHEHLVSGGTPVEEIPDRMRRLTIEEAAALQSFPHDMPWSGCQSARFRQIGNAVPPRLAFAVASALAEHLQLPVNPIPSLLDSLASEDEASLGDSLATE